MRPAFKRLLQQPLLWLSVCFLLSLFVLVYPVYVIRPFRYQGALELTLALAITRYRSGLVVALSVVAVLTLAICWQQNSRTWQKVLSAVCAGLVVVLALFSRINIYELMFHPLDRAMFSRASEARLDGEEEVITIQVNGEARAYPVRSMSYHHIVNDFVGGQPIVATY